MFETFDHTADLGLRVSARSLNELFSEAGIGLTSLIVADIDSVQQSQQRVLSLNSPDLEYLYFDWLSELLYLYDSQDWLTAGAHVNASESSLHATLYGEEFSEERHRRSHEVKAVTYHGLSVVQRDVDGTPTWTAETIVDI